MSLGVVQRYLGVFRGLVVSAGVFRFREGAQLFGVDVPQLLQLPLASPVQILDVHHVRLLDACVLPELVTDSGDEARLVLPGSQELAVQSQDLFLQPAVPRHRAAKNEIREQLLMEAWRQQELLPAAAEGSERFTCRKNTKHVETTAQKHTKSWWGPQSDLLLLL